MRIFVYSRNKIQYIKDNHLFDIDLLNSDYVKFDYSSKIWYTNYVECSLLQHKIKERSVQMNIRTNQANLLIDFLSRYPSELLEISKRIRLEINSIDLAFYEFSSEDQCHTKIRRSNLKGLQYNAYEVLYQEEEKSLNIQILFK